MDGDRPVKGAGHKLNRFMPIGGRNAPGLRHFGHMDIGAALRSYMRMRLRSALTALALPLFALAASGAAFAQDGQAPAKKPFRLEFLEPAPEPAEEQVARPVKLPPQSKSTNPADIEAESGGRLGIALVDARGKLILGFNRDDRFAMCSTFKAPLAAAILLASQQGRFGLEGNLPISEADLLDYAPVVKDNLKRGRMAIGDLAQAAVEVSDNSAANMLLPLVGGPAGLTAFMRVHGDTVSRLDRKIGRAHV